MPTDLSTFDAFRSAQSREIMPTSLGTAELRDMDAGVLARSVFTARGTNVIFLSKLKEVAEAMASGEMDIATARVTLLETLRALGYTPEGGFPDVPPGTVPPAIRGSLQDLSSFRRLDLIVRTQQALMAGAGQQFRGHTPDRLADFPAWELVRLEQRATPRDWLARWRIAGGLIYGDVTPEMTADGQVRATGRMIALKGDPVWGELGAAGNFDDALNVDYPPFAFNSGMGWMEISRDECEALGVLGPDGQAIDDFHTGAERPQVILGELPLPSPKLGLKDADPELLDKFKEETKAEPVPESDEWDYSALLEQEIAAAAEAYAEGRRTK